MLSSPCPDTTVNPGFRRRDTLGCPFEVARRSNPTSWSYLIAIPAPEPVCLRRPFALPSAPLPASPTPSTRPPPTSAPAPPLPPAPPHRTVSAPTAPRLARSVPSGIPPPPSHQPH